MYIAIVAEKLELGRGVKCQMKRDSAPFNEKDERVAGAVLLEREENYDSLANTFTNV